MAKANKKQQYLFDACKSGDLKLAKMVTSSFLFFKGITVNTKDENGETPLLVALKNGHDDIVEFLISKEADVNAKDRAGFSPLINASGNGRKDIIELLITKGADVNAKDKAGITPLISASRNGRKDIVALLITKGAVVNIKDSEGNTPLIYATMKGSIEIVEILISKGAEVNCKSGITPLICASRENQIEIAALLIDKGAYVNAKDNDGNTPLAYASLEDSIELADLLISKGADVNAKDNSNISPLMWASREGRIKTTEFLISKGAIVNANDNEGNTPLVYAVKKGFKNIAEMLISKGADINAKDNTRNTSLICALEKGFKDIVELLILKDADVNAKNTQGDTPLHFALNKGFKEISNLLIDKGANLNAQNKSGITPDMIRKQIEFASKKEELSILLKEAINLLNKAYNGAFVESSYEKDAIQALDKICAMEFGADILFEYLFRNIELKNGFLTLTDTYGESAYSEWIRKSAIVDVLGRSHATHKAKELIALMMAKSNINQFYDILQPRIAEALGEMGDKTAIEALSKALYNDNLSNESKRRIGKSLEKLTGKIVINPALIIAKADNMNKKSNGDEVLNLLSQIDPDMFKNLTDSQKYYVWYMRGLVYKLQNNKIRAIECFQKSLEYFNDDTVMAHQHLKELK